LRTVHSFENVTHGSNTRTRAPRVPAMGALARTRAKRVSSTGVGQARGSCRPRQAYPTDLDLNDIEWQVIRPMRRWTTGGHPRKSPVRGLLRAMFYVVLSGCAARMVPRALTVEDRITKLCRRNDATCEKLNASLVEAVRRQAQRGSQPSTAVIDSDHRGIVGAQPAPRQEGRLARGRAPSARTPSCCNVSPDIGTRAARWPNFARLATR